MIGRGLLLPVCLLFSCGPDAAETASGEVDHPHFTVRGRWEDPLKLLYRIELEGASADAEIFRSAVERAMGPWRTTGLVDFSSAEQNQAPDVTFAWRRDAHGSCEPFGSSTAVAHSGPVATGTFVHFDAGRTWSEDGATGVSLFHTALHEIGHVLGLGHSVASDALMRPDFSQRSTLSDSERSGIHSLYGGGEDRGGDLEILRPSGGEVILTLRRVAPVGVTETTLFDSDGDGDDEVLIWRTDRPGNGALMIYHFSEDLKLSHTVGPLYGMSAPEVPNLFVRTVDGERLMVGIYPGGRLLTRSFDERGLLLPRANAPLIVDGGIRDADGDGRLDGEQLSGGNGGTMIGDLNGDGQQEKVAMRR